MKGWRPPSLKVEACSFPPDLKNSFTCAGVSERNASGSGGISAMRILVPFTGVKSRTPWVGSASVAAIGTGMAEVFQISVDLWPGRFGWVLMDVQGPSDSTIALPFLSWPVTTRRIVPSPILLSLNAPLFRLDAGKLDDFREPLDRVLHQPLELRGAAADGIEADLVVERPGIGCGERLAGFRLDTR